VKLLYFRGDAAFGNPEMYEMGFRNKNGTFHDDGAFPCPSTITAYMYAKYAEELLG
jgi:hypothetical protein